MVTKYPWQTWFKENEFLLERGKDYHCSQSSFAQQIRIAASKRGLSVSLVDVDNGIAVRVNHKEKQCPSQPPISASIREPKGR